MSRFNIMPRAYRLRAWLAKTIAPEGVIVLDSCDWLPLLRPPTQPYDPIDLSNEYRTITVVAPLEDNPK